MIVKAVVKKYNAVNAIRYCLTAVIGGAAVLVGIDLFQTLAKDGLDMAAEDFCVAPKGMNSNGGRRLVELMSTMADWAAGEWSGGQDTLGGMGDVSW